MTKTLVKELKLQKIKYGIYLVPNPYKHPDLGFYFQAFKDDKEFTSPHETYNDVIKYLKINHNKETSKTKKHPKSGKDVYVDFNRWNSVSSFYAGGIFNGFIENLESHELLAQVEYIDSKDSTKKIKEFPDRVTIYLKTPETEVVYKEISLLAKEEASLELEHRKILDSFTEKINAILKKSNDLKEKVKSHIVKFPVNN